MAVLTLLEHASLPQALTVGGLREEADRLLLASKAAATMKAYRSDWAAFESWAQSVGRSALPADPESVVLYLTALHGSGKRISTIRRRVATISQAHQHAGHETPTRDRRVRALVQGIARASNTTPKKKKAIGIAEVRALLATIPPDALRGRRDRALLLVGFVGAMRRSELVGIDHADVEFIHDEGAVITIRKSKTDQEGRGRRVGIPIGKHSETCPVIALQAWIQSSEISDGPLFRPIDRHGRLRRARLTDHAAALIVKAAAKRAGLDSRLYSGHSLRSGFATSASRAGAPEALIARQTGHRSLAMLREYVQAGNVLTENAARSLDL